MRRRRLQGYLVAIGTYARYGRLAVGVLVGVAISVSPLVGVAVGESVGVSVGVLVGVGVAVGSGIRPASTVRRLSPGASVKKSLSPVIGSTSLSVASVAPGARLAVNAYPTGCSKTSR